jgi:hypothetical protein
MNAPLKFALSLVILLLSGCVQLSAYASSSTKSYSGQSSSEVSEKSVQFSNGLSSSKEQQKHNVHEFLFENEEENESESFKKRLANNNASANYIFTQPSIEFLSCTKIPSRYQHFLFSASYRYLIIQVFRI